MLHGVWPGLSPGVLLPSKRDTLNFNVLYFETLQLTVMQCITLTKVTIHCITLQCSLLHSFLHYIILPLQGSSLVNSDSLDYSSDSSISAVL